MIPIYAPGNFHLIFTTLFQFFIVFVFRPYMHVNILFYLKFNIEKVHTHREKKTFKNDSFYPVLFT